MRKEVKQSRRGMCGHENLVYDHNYNIFDLTGLIGSNSNCIYQQLPVTIFCLVQYFLGLSRCDWSARCQPPPHVPQSSSLSIPLGILGQCLTGDAGFWFPHGVVDPTPSSYPY